MAKLDHAKLKRQRAAQDRSEPIGSGSTLGRYLFARQLRRRRAKLNQRKRAARNRPDSLDLTKRVQGEPKLRRKQIETVTGAHRSTDPLVVL